MDKTALTIIISGFCACYCIFLIIVALVGIFSRLDPVFPSYKCLIFSFYMV